MRTLFPTTLLLVLSFVVCQNATAQNTPPSFQELERQMLEMQQRLMDQFKNSPFNDPNFARPQWDTTFQFRFDTTFEGGNISQFFRFSPFGSEADTTKGDFFGFDRFLDQFFNSDTPFKQPDYGIKEHQFPSDDGEEQNANDGLLPEERLRKQEEAEKSGQRKPEKKDAAPKPDPKIKTIRI